MILDHSKTTSLKVEDLLEVILALQANQVRVMALYSALRDLQVYFLNDKLEDSAGKKAALDDFMNILDEIGPEFKNDFENLDEFSNRLIKRIEDGKSEER